METTSNLVVHFIVNAMWQASILSAIGAICARLMRNAAARHKHILWTAALILSVALPILSVCNYRADNFSFGFRLPFVNNRSDVSGGGQPNGQETAADEFAVKSGSGLDSSDLSAIFSAITVFYFAFLFYRLTNLLLTWRLTARLRRSAKNEKLPASINAAARRCSDVLQTSRVPILFSSEINAPLTLGWRKPSIILPESFLGIDSEETLAAALGHESAHIRRGDYGLNLICEFLSLLVSFHPAVSIMKRQINRTREMACDELVAEHLLKPLDYARSLIRIAGLTAPANRNALTLGVFNADILEKRIMKLIETSRGAKTRVGKIRILFIVVLLSATAMTASVFSFGLPNSEKAANRGETDLAENNFQTTETKNRRQDKRVLKRKRADGQSAAPTKEDGIAPLRLLSKPTPTYTDEARKNGASGSVKLRVTFLDSGTIGDVIPLNTLPDGLTESAVEAAKSIKFQPATKNGTPVTVVKLVEYSFTTF